MHPYINSEYLKPTRLTPRSLNHTMVEFPPRIGVFLLPYIGLNFTAL
jgi:hypothetical protein